jgi:HlyD family secretion protein
MKKPLIWTVVLVALAAGVFAAGQKWPNQVYFWKTAQKEEAARPGRATTAVVAPRDISFAITAAGEITPAEQVSVRPEISGRINLLSVDIGDRIKKGDILFTLDDQDLQTEKAQRQIEIEGSKLQVNAARLALERAELSFKRTQELAEVELVSQEVFDNTRLERDVARNALEIAQNNLERTGKMLQIVEDKLVRTKIVAPFDCTILTRPVSIGQAVSGASGVAGGTEVLTIADLGELIINAHINQADVTRMSVNQPVQIEVEAVAGLKLKGRLDRIAPQATIRNGIKGFATRIIVKNNSESGVRPGMTANLTIPLQGASDVLAVPLAAVFTDQGERFAYVQQGGKFERVPIRIGVTDYDFAEVTSGLQGGETVSLVTPSEDAGKAQQAFGAAAKKGGGGSGGGSRGGDSKGATPSTGGSGSKGSPATARSGGSGGDRRSSATQ